MRGKKLIVLVTGIVVLVAAVVFLAANAAARRGADAGRPGTSATTTAKSEPSGGTSDQGSASHGAAGGVAAVGLRPGAVSPSAAGLATAEALLPNLTPDQLAGQRVIYSYTGLNPPARLLDLIRHGEAAGVILFGGNVVSAAQVASVMKKLQQAADSSSDPVHLPLLLMTDQEGGQVRRLPGEPVLSAKAIGRSAHPWATATSEGKLGAQNMRRAGLNVNLAPVLDVYRQAGNFIDEFGRSFSSKSGTVSKLGELFARAEQAQGVAATVKHFPGLGAAARTQNTDVRPVTLSLSLSAIRTIDEVPYKAAIAAKVKLVMASWAIYPALDSKKPAGLSSTIVQGELRTRLGFAGVTITDALEAGALGPFGSIAHRAYLAAKAGMDLLLCSQGSYSEGLSALNSISFDYTHHSLNATAFKAAVARILALRATLPRP